MSKADHFQRFWDVYPNRKGKVAAQKAFEKMSKGEDIGEFTHMICLAIEAQKRYRNEAKNSGEFIPNWKMPATWLNSGCWDDEIKSHSDIKNKVALQTCKTCGVRPVIGQRFDECDGCHPRGKSIPFNKNSVSMDDLRDHYRNNPEIKGFTVEQHKGFMDKVLNRKARIGK